MMIHIKSLGFHAGEAVQQHISQRLAVALSHWADRLKRVVVRLGDVNGPKGGLDKSCSIQLLGPQGVPLKVVAVATDYPTAVDLAVRRAGRAVQHAFDRRFN